MSTLREVAQACGVSVQTVSRILNGGQQHRYRETTRARVHAAARALGYRPSGVAQAMRTRRLASVGLFSCLEPRFGLMTARLWSGIQHALVRRDYNLISGVPPRERPAAADRLPAILQQQLVAGLLVNFTLQIPDWVREWVAGEDRPAVWINARLPSLSCVFLADEEAAHALTGALLARGHRRIAYLDYVNGTVQPHESHYSVREREAGYVRAMREAGLAPRVIRPWTTIRAAGEGVSLSAEWLRRPDRPTAVVAYDLNNSLRSVAYAALYDGVEPPAMAAFASDPVREGRFTAATAVVPEWDLGERAAELLLDWIETGEAPAADAGRLVLSLAGVEGIPGPGMSGRPLR